MDGDGLARLHDGTLALDQRLGDEGRRRFTVGHGDRGGPVIVERDRGLAGDGVDRGALGPAERDAHIVDLDDEEERVVSLEAALRVAALGTERVIGGDGGDGLAPGVQPDQADAGTGQQVRRRP